MDQQELLLRTAEILEKLKIPYMVTGSAVNFYGTPRTTNDIDRVVQIHSAVGVSKGASGVRLDAEPRGCSSFQTTWYKEAQTDKYLNDA